MITRITKNVKRIMSNKHAKFWHNPFKIEWVIAPWKLLLKIDIRNRQRFDNLQRGKKHCYDLLTPFTKFQEVSNHSQWVMPLEICYQR